ncbi:unnamed protein product [Phytophthora fragariaefolia]|uniref:Unnamed protein product n=1 Tax=Phytophthora fragariaefolia TaxID=1490495 RepID=A0A9W6YB99_9STRA|nr:unnamed protein product [Phytophthora fragariaefolia]
MEDSGSRLPTRQDFPHLTDANWATLEKMVSLLGKAAFAGFPNLTAEQQKARVERFDKHESSLIAHVSAAAQEGARAAMRAEAQSAAQASATNSASFTARPTTTKPVKMSVPTFDGKDSDSLVFWVREIEIALRAGQINDARAQVAFALSNLGGRARAWTMARERLLRARQASHQDYVMELHNLEAAMAGAPLSEDVKVTVFMDGVRTGPVRTELFRRQQKTINEAVHIAMLEDHCVCSAQGHTPHVEEQCIVCYCFRSSKSKINVSVRLATGSIVSTRKVTIPLNVKFDDFDSVEPFIVLDMDDRYDLILGIRWLTKHEPWTDWRSRTIGASHNPLADRALVGHVPSASRDGLVYEHRVPRGEWQFAGSSEVLELPMASPPRAREPEVGDGEDPQDPNTSPMGRQGRSGSVRAPPTQSLVAGSAHVEECAGVIAHANKSGRGGTPTTQGVVPDSARATEGTGACARATTGGRAGSPTSNAIRGNKVPSTPKAEAYSRDADSAAEDRVPQVLDVFTGEHLPPPKVREVLTPLPTVAELLELEELSYVEFLDSLKAGEFAEVVLLRPEGGSLELNSSSVIDSEVLEDERTSRRQTRYGAAILKDPSDPYHLLLKEFLDVVSDDPPSVDVIDAFFAAKHAAGMVRESKSPHSSPTFCVRKPNGKWRMVHAFNKLSAATVPASTPIPRKDVLQNNMAGYTVFSALDMVDGYYQLLMRESDIPLTAVSTPRGMLWEWSVMPQGLSNAPATFNQLVTQFFRPMRHFVQTYFDDIFVHSRASESKTAVEAHLVHLREVLLCMRENHLYANINKCIFGAEAIPFLGCFLGKDGVRADPEKVCAIAQWPVPVAQKDLRKWLGLANDLHKYSANYADMARPLTNLLKKDSSVWSWTSEAQQALKPSRAASRALRFCLYLVRIGPSAWYAMHPTLPLAVPCYRLMPRAVSG